MKNISIYIVIVLCLFILSWCSSINNNEFDRKVECYKLWKQYIKDLENLYEGSNRFYYINWIYYNKKEQTCFMEYTENFNDYDWKANDHSYILDILKENLLISNIDELQLNKYLEIKNIIQWNPEYKSFNFN